MLNELTNKIKKILPEISWKVKDGYVLKRDITLEDVLRCLEEKFKDNDYCKKRKSVYNAFSCFEVVRMWQLGKPLHEQSEETIKELNKLI